jgi:hypothetical protein
VVVALITAPTFALSGIQWALDRPAQINVAVSGKRTADEPLYGKWSGHVDLMTTGSESDFLPIRSFLVRCNGPVNTFDLPATVEPQNADSGVTVASTVAAGVVTLSLSGYSTPLTDGQMVTVGGQLLQLTADQSGAAITFEPPLRVQATAGDAVETANPFATVRLTQSEVGYTIEPPQRFTTSFDVEEEF